MLWTPSSELGYSVSNGGSYIDASLGTSISAAGSANTKNTTITQLLAGSSVSQDIYGLCIGFNGGDATGAARRYMTDFYFDPSGGTAWEPTPRISNLAANAPELLAGGVWYYFPLYIRKNTSIGATCQSATASAPVSVFVRGFGKPKRPELIRAGSKVVTYGADTATTVGTALTPGTSGSKGAWTSIANTTSDHFWWQFAYLVNDTSQTAQAYFADVSIGNNHEIAILDLMGLVIGNAEQSGKAAFGTNVPFKEVRSGNQIWARMATSIATADSNVSAIVYGVTD